MWPCFCHYCMLHQSLLERLVPSKHSVDSSWARHCPPTCRCGCDYTGKGKQQWGGHLSSSGSDKQKCPLSPELSHCTTTLCTLAGSIHANNDMRSFPQQSNKPQVEAPDLNAGNVSLYPREPIRGMKYFAIPPWNRYRT